MKKTKRGPILWNTMYICLSIVMVRYSFNKIKLASDAQYKIVILALFTYLVVLGLVKGLVTLVLA